MSEYMSLEQLVANFTRLYHLQSEITESDTTIVTLYKESIPKRELSLTLTFQNGALLSSELTADKVLSHLRIIQAFADCGERITQRHRYHERTKAGDE